MSVLETAEPWCPEPPPEEQTTPVDRSEWPVHQPICHDAPIPGGPHWGSACDPDFAYVNPETGICDGCGLNGCVACGREDCPDGDECEGAYQ